MPRLSGQPEKNEPEVIVAGIDVGSRSIKVVILDHERRLMARAMKRTRPDFQAVTEEALNLALQEASLKKEDLHYVATTGFGRYNIPFRDIQITDITTDAKGAAFLIPATECVLDIGFQSTRVMRLRDGGRVKVFKSNDKCAAGAGGFLERTARYLETKMEDLGELSLRADRPLTVSSVCAVLAESEIINHMTEGQSQANIIRGIHDSLASRAQSLLARVGLGSQITLVGGVARQAGMVKALEERLGVTVQTPEEPEFVAALGAALLGLRRLEKLEEKHGSILAGQGR